MNDSIGAPLSLLALLSLSACATVAPPDDDADTARVVFATELGEIEMAIDTERAPLTAANFLGYVADGFYDGGRFHRAVRLDNQVRDDVKIEVVQADIDRGRESRPPIELERTSVTGVRHAHGTVSMARSGPDTARASFFICIGDQPSLDFGGARNADGQGFAAFGRVVRGMDVVRRIQQSKTDARERLTPPIAIVTARRVR